MSNVSLAQRIGSAVFWNSILLPIRTLLPFLANILLVRALSTEQMAVLVSITAVLGTIGQYADLGIERSLSKFIPEVDMRFGRRRLLQFLSAAVGLELASLAILLLGLNLFSDFFSGYFHFGDQGLVYIHAISVLLVLGVLSDVLLQLLYSFFRQKAVNGLGVAYSLLQPLLLITFITLGFEINGVLLALIISTAAQVALGMFLSWRLLKAEGRRVPREQEVTPDWRNLARRFGQFSALNYFFNLTTYFYDLPFIVVVLSQYNDLVGLALFGIAYQRIVMPILRLLSAPLTGVMQPLFARLYVEQDRVKLQSAYAGLSRFLILLLLPSGVGLILVARNVIRILFQARYEAAASLVAWLVLFLFLESLLSPAHNVLLAHEVYRITIWARALGLVSIPFMFILTPVYGVLGATVAAGIGRVLSRAVSTGYVLRRYNLQFPWAFFGRVGMAAGLMGLVLYFFLFMDRPSSPVDTVLQTAVAMAAGVVLFGVALKLLGGVEAEDRKRLAGLRVPFATVLVRFI